MSRSLLAVLLVCVAMSMVAAEANLLAVKVFKNDFFVQNRNLEVEFQFHNVGDDTAYDVSIKDENWEPEFFTLVSGSFEGSIAEIPSKQNATISFTVLPLSADLFVDKPSYFEYRRTQDAEPTIAQTSAGGQFNILTEEEYQGSFASHTIEWTIVGLLVALTVGGPFLVSNNLENTLKKQ